MRLRICTAPELAGRVSCIPDRARSYEEKAALAAPFLSQAFGFFADGLPMTPTDDCEAGETMKDLRSRYDAAVAELPPAFDRRDQERIALKIPVRVLNQGLLFERSADAVCTDLSEGGIAFETSAQLNVGEVVAVEFQSKSEAVYRCQVRLTYRMGPRYGGYFVGGA
jgi:hypothetical protein